MSKLQRKTALSSFDLAILVDQLRPKLLKSKINSINSSRSAIILKLHSPFTQEKPKFVLTPQAVYTTKYEVTSASAPTAFVQILRRELSGMHISALTQVNFDRTLIIAFEARSKPRRLLILELFGKGNAILTDSEYRVLASQTPYRQPAYVVQLSPMLSDILGMLSLDALRECIETAKTAHGQQNQLRYVLANRYYIGGALASVILRYCGLSGGIKCTNPKIDVGVVFSYLERLVRGLSSSIGKKDAYTYYYSESSISVDASVPEDVRRSLRVAEIYPVDLNSIFPGLYQSDCATHDASFVDAVDEYFNMLQTAAAYQNMFELIQTQNAKHDRLQTENDQKTNALLQEAQFIRFLGAATMLNQAVVDRVLSYIQNMFACGVLTWGSIAHEMNKQDFKVFKYIDSVETKQRTLQLRITITKEQLEALEYSSFAKIDAMTRQEDEDSEECIQAEETTEKVYTIQARLGDTATAIASALFDRAKEMERKAGRTAQHTDEAVSRIQKLSQLKIDKIIKEADQDLTIFTKQRPQLWFEKFNWFFSSDGLLILSGRDAQSNEILVKRFMLDNDIFVHADVHGAACTLIKAPTPNTLFIPPEATVRQAACQTVTHSRLWDTRVSAQSYWVYGSQVSKTAPTGQYIGTGSFVIRGKRNFLEPSEMKLGIALLFRYDQPQDYFRSKQPVQIEDLRPAQKADETAQYMIISTKKAKQVKQTAGDASKQQHKEEQKLKRKERQQNIAKMRFEAKIRRLKVEGREDEIEQAIADKKVKTQEEKAEPQDFCFLCGGAHYYQNCNGEHLEDAPSDEQNSEEHSESDESASVEREAQDVQYQLLESAYVLSPIYKKEERPIVCIMVAPLQAIPIESHKLELQPGNTPKSQCTNIAKEYFAKQYTGDQQITQQLKNIQDYQVVFSIPGSCQISGYGVGKLIQEARKQGKQQKFAKTSQQNE